MRIEFVINPEYDKKMTVVMLKSRDWEYRAKNMNLDPDLVRRINSGKGEEFRQAEKELSDFITDAYESLKFFMEKEEQDIQKELNALKARTNNWMDLAIKTFNFAKNAKYHFEHGTFEDKTLILRTLGSNFYMLNGKLCVDLIKPFFIFKNNQELVNVPFETIENPEYAMVGANTGDFEHWFLQWSG